MTQEQEYDVVVIGSGIAGLTTAVGAREKGLRVAVLEKQADAGGSSVMSGGYFAFSGTAEQAAAGVEDSEEIFYNDLLAGGNFESDPALLRAYLDNQADAYEWLKSKGVRFRAPELSSGQSRPRSHLSEIKGLVANLAADFTSNGGDLYLNHRAVALGRNADGRVASVTAQTSDGPALFAGRHGVVIASGGFSRGRDLLKIFAPEQLGALPYGGLGNTGDGLKLAWKLGAGLADMSHISGTYGSHPDTSLAFHELLTAYYIGAIIVNSSGRRFVDESVDYKALGSAALRQPGGIAYQVFDATVRAKSEPGVPLKDSGMLEEIGHLFRADTIEELGRLAGIDPAGLAETVRRYNDAIANRRPDELGRTALCNGVGDLLPVRQTPFYAYRAKSLMTTTYAGLTITPHGEVTDVDGQVIEGLYAVGEVVGGFHGASYMTGTSLGKGVVFGRIVAHRIGALTGHRSGQPVS